MARRGVWVCTSPSGYVTAFGEACVPTPGLEQGVRCNPRVTFDGKVRNLGSCVLKFDSLLPEDHGSTRAHGVITPAVGTRLPCPSQPPEGGRGSLSSGQGLLGLNPRAVSAGARDRGRWWTLGVFTETQVPSHALPHPPLSARAPVMVGIRSPLGWWLGLHQPPWSFGFDSQTRGTRENRTTPCVKVPGSSRVPCIRYCSNKQQLHIAGES